MALEAANIAAEAAGPFKEILSSEFVSKMEEKVSSFAENIPWLMNVLDEVTALHPAIQGRFATAEALNLGTHANPHVSI